MSERFYRFDICCNDPDNGMFARECAGIALHFGRDIPALEIGVTSSRLPGFLIIPPDKHVPRFRLGRTMYAYESSGEWVGNWAWNSYTLQARWAARLVQNLMRDDRFACEGGMVDACNAYEEGDLVAFFSIWTAELYPPRKAQIVGSEV